MPAEGFNHGASSGRTELRTGPRYGGKQLIWYVRPVQLSVNVCVDRLNGTFMPNCWREKVQV